jgi:hypothetical protein
MQLKIKIFYIPLFYCYTVFMSLCLCLFGFLTLCIYVFLSFCRSVCLSSRLSVLYHSVLSYVILSFSLFVSLSFSLSVYLFLCLSVSLTWTFDSMAIPVTPWRTCTSSPAMFRGMLNNKIWRKIFLHMVYSCNVRTFRNLKNTSLLRDQSNYID